MQRFRPKAAHLAAVAVLPGLMLAGSGCGRFAPKLVGAKHTATRPASPQLPHDARPVPAANTPVLEDGRQIVAHAPWGRIKIAAGPGLRRIYTWRGMRRGAILKPRTQAFPGCDTLGLTYDGTPPVWKPANGITRLRVEEGTHDFDTVGDAIIWMKIQRLRYTYNDSGLVVGWRPKGNTLHVELWQFYIDGEKPTSMPDARDQSIVTGPIGAASQKL